MSRLGSQFAISPNKLLNYTQEELLDLFIDKFVPDRQLKSRSVGFSVRSVNGKSAYLSGHIVGTMIKRLNESRSSDHSKLQGITANPGLVLDRVKLIHTDYSDFSKLNREIKRMKAGQILVAETTAPELIVACKKASAIVTDQGGLMSHAAIVSRELGIPCVVGTKFATKVFKDGDLVEVDANHGWVRKLTK